MSHFAPRFSTKGVLGFADSGGGYHSISFGAARSCICMFAQWKTSGNYTCKSASGNTAGQPRTVPQDENKKKLGDAVAAKLDFPLSADSWRCPNPRLSVTAVALG